MFLSKRLYDVISRWLRVHWDYILKNGNNYKNIYKPIVSIIYKDMILAITSRIHHEDYCIGDCLILRYTLSISDITNKILLDSIIFYQETELNEIIAELSSRIGKEYTLCICETEVAAIDGLCKQCYIFQYERTEEEGGDCCICLTNIGSWVKLPCEHYIHLQCCFKMDVKKCPLCRTDFNDIIINPYDL